MAKKVFVSGCYDLLHSGHVEFFRQAAQYGDLYVGIGSDATILEYKHHKTVYCEQERLFMVKSIRYVKDAFINAGHGIMDFIPTVEALKPDILVVNEDGANEEKRRFCEERGIEYVVLSREPHEGLEARSSTSLKQNLCMIPTRLDLAGTWIDQPSVNCFAPGWAITISLEPTFEIRDRCGLSTSTRNMIKKIWPYQLPKMDPEMLAKLVFCFENDPERSDGIISGAQDSIGICVPGLCRHYYNNRFWPEKIETCYDEPVLSWLEEHLVMIPMEPRKPDCSVVEGKDITEVKVKALTKAADDCWEAILHRDLSAFAQAYADSFHAQTALFPAMIQGCVADYIERYKNLVLAYKMPGAGGGGYLACVVTDAVQFAAEHPEAFRLVIRRPEE
ncbi:MAG: adenylyltransferase/cytidyltransferase family protein [Bacteroidaceae bacterium]|nr:adenylyltransferase/cytidyltransferase family protein [Bacteroidaceae bacterium]